MNWVRVNAVMLAAMVALMAIAAAPASAGVPTDQLRGAVERVLKALDDPSLKGQGKLGERRVAVRKIANEIFDFAEIAKRSLAQHWQPLSEAQRNEFVGLFADLLERSYISKIETYGGEKIQYTAERMDGDYATVSTKIVTKNGTEVPVDYRMVKRADHWLVYDVSIEGVSLVSSYRTQFNKIIQTSSYNELVTKLRTKQDELMAEDKAQKKKL
ncbi:MAG TPA: ABC transporter substrate-binding protein [Methylomirabilota bacterium]|jgi:phospholipid transport system substrate-binding protein|nr:ABC transporter substrate-binding protein [Methylomirabilota bacterium]